MALSYGVVTATLNARGSVLATLRSVISQSPAPTQYIVIDGGSTDGTRELVEAEFAATRARGCPIELQLIIQAAPKGIAHAWNHAIAQLTSDVVFLVNADDWLEADAAEHVMDAFARDAELDVVHGNARFHSMQGEDLGVLAPCWVNRLGVQCRTLHCSTCVRRRVYEELGGFDHSYCTTLDYDFLERCWRRGKRFRHIDRVLSNFRLGGISNTFRSRADLETLKIGLNHSRTKVLPLAAYALRRFVLRPMGIAGFDLWMKRGARMEQRSAAIHVSPRAEAVSDPNAVVITRVAYEDHIDAPRTTATANPAAQLERIEA